MKKIDSFYRMPYKNSFILNVNSGNKDGKYTVTDKTQKQITRSLYTVHIIALTRRQGVSSWIMMSQPRRSSLGRAFPSPPFMRARIRIFAPAASTRRVASTTAADAQYRF